MPTVVDRRLLLVMARPVKLKSSSNLHFRQRVPKDVLRKARGETIAARNA
jgi:hypothetical protein